MARRPRRSAKRSTPRPARRPSAKPCLHSAMERVRASFAEAAPKLRARIEAGHELWQSLAGEPMPLDLDDMQSAAVRFGLPADVVYRGDFKLAEVTNFMVGKRVAALDELHDRVRAAEAEAAVRRSAGIVTPSTSTPVVTQSEAVDDECSRLARKIKGNSRAVLLRLYARNAFCADTARTRECIAAGLVADGVPVSANTVKNAIASLRNQGKAVGLNVVESLDSGSWLPPDGKRLAALVPKLEAVSTRQASLKVRGG